MTPNDPSRDVRYVLDTDTVTYQQLGRPAVLRRIAQVNPGEAATTIVSMYEQLRGRLAAIDRARDDQSLRTAYVRLEETQAYYCQTRILPFDPAAAAIFRSLVASLRRVGTQDLRIAAIVLANDATLVTSNRRDFGQIPNLRIEDWNVD